MRGHRRRGRPDPRGQPQHQQGGVLGEHQPPQGPVPVAQGAEQGQLAPPLPDVAQQDHGEAECPEEQAEPAQDLKRGEVGVFNRQVRREALARRGNRYATTVQGGLEQGSHIIPTPGRWVKQKNRKTFLPRVQLQEVRPGHQKFALEHAVLQQSDDAELHRPPLFVRHFDRPAEVALEHPLHRMLLAEYGDRSVRGRCVEQAPRILTLLGRAGVRAGEAKPAAVDERLRHAEHPRPAGLVQVQAARIVAGLQSQRDDRR